MHDNGRRKNPLARARRRSRSFFCVSRAESFGKSSRRHEKINTGKIRFESIIGIVMNFTVGRQKQISRNIRIVILKKYKKKVYAE